MGPDPLGGPFHRMRVPPPPGQLSLHTITKQGGVWGHLEQKNFEAKKFPDGLQPSGNLQKSVLHAGQSSGDDCHGVDLLGVTAAAEVVDGGVQTQQDGSVGVEGAQTLGDLVTDVARVDVRANEGVGITGHLRLGALGLRHAGGDTAASNCSSPSTGMLGRTALVFSAALRILSTSSPLPEPKVE